MAENKENPTITQLYDLIMDAIDLHCDDLCMAELIGILEMIKAEVIADFLKQTQEDGQ